MNAITQFLQSNWPLFSGAGGFVGFVVLFFMINNLGHKMEKGFITVNNRLDNHDRELKELRGDIVELKRDMVEVKDEIREIKVEIVVIKSDVRILKKDVKELQRNMIKVKSDITALKIKKV